MTVSNERKKGVTKFNLAERLLCLPKKADVAIYCGLVRFERTGDILEIV
jgi:hypothetical protein